MSTHTKPGRVEEGGEGEESERDWACTSTEGRKQESAPCMGWCFRTEGKHLTLSEGTAADLRQVERNEDHVSLPPPDVLWTRTQVPWNTGQLESSPRARSAVPAPGDKREAIRLWGEAGRP